VPVDPWLVLVGLLTGAGAGAQGAELVATADEVLELTGADAGAQGAELVATADEALEVAVVEVPTGKRAPVVEVPTSPTPKRANGLDRPTTRLGNSRPKSLSRSRKIGLLKTFLDKLMSWTDKSKAKKSPPEISASGTELAVVTTPAGASGAGVMKKKR